MIDQLIEFDREILRFFNGLHMPWLDPVMLVLTETIAWIPLYVFMLYVIIKEYKRDVWIILLGLALTILLADQITANLMKPYFARLRPSQEPSLGEWLHIVNGYKGGKFGFASSHAANTFGAATFFYLWLRKTKAWVPWLFAWAAFMSYTRIYLGVHYPGDIMVGAVVGVACGGVSFKFTQWLKMWDERRRIPSSG